MTVTIRTDETLDIQGGTQETLNGVPSVLISALFGSLPPLTPAPTPVSVAKWGTPFTYTGLTNLAFSDASGELFDGEFTTLKSLSGAPIYLYTLSSFDNVVVGLEGRSTGVTGQYEADPNGRLIFAAYADTGATTVNESDAGKTSADVWLVQYQALSHGNTSSVNESVFLNDILHLSSTTASQFEAKGAPSGQNLFLMFGDTTPVAGEVALVVTGQAKDSTVNTSQGGGITTIGTNNQMVDPGEGLYFSFVKLSDASLPYTMPQLDQNEADLTSNIQFESFYGVKTAFFNVVQTQPNKPSTLTITAINNTDSSGASERGVNFIAGYTDGDETSVNISAVQITRLGSTTPISFVEGSQSQSGITVNFSGATAVIIGAKAGDRIQYTSDTDHNRVLIQNTGNAKTGANSSFDIGDFQLGGVTQQRDVVNLEFLDDGPRVSIARVAGAVDEDGLPFGITDNNIGTGGGDLAGAALTASGSVSTLFSVGADQPGTYSVDPSAAASVQLANPDLRSGGTALTYTALGDTLTAKAGAATVFTFQLTSTGDFTFTLLRPLDHAISSVEVENDLSIDLSAVVRLTDKDGDAVVAASGALVITVDDDGPALSGTPEIGFVDEDALTGGNPGGIGDYAGDATYSGLLSAVFSSGADLPLTYGLFPASTGLPELTSAGVPVTYAVLGNVLTASAGGEPVFTFAITNTTTGAYTFTLLEPLDQAAGQDENNLEIDLSAFVQATDYDGDTVKAGPGALVMVGINADDDTPVVTANTVPVSVDEDGLPFGLVGNNTGTGGGDLGGAELTASGSVSSLFSVGADQPGTYSIDPSAAASVQLANPNLSSGGVALTYEAVGDTLTAKAGTATVFTFQLSSLGNFTFNLVGQLDHANGPDLDVENDLTIDLSAVVRLTDKDGDSVIAAARALTITVDDDGPALSGRTETGAVNEDVLTGGNPGGIGDNAATATDTGSVAVVFSSGADQPLTYGLSPVVTGLQSLTSAGATVTYAVVDNVLTASASGEPVFTFAITDSATGAYTFTLLKPLDHPAGQDENDIVIDLSTIVQATDYDGDTVRVGAGLVVVSITANDDTPVVTANAVPVAVDEDGLPFGIASNNTGTGGGDLAGAATAATGSVSTLFSVGADQPGTYSIDPSAAASVQLANPDLSSGGVALTYEAVGDTLTAKAGTATVFTFQLSSLGNFTFTLVGQLDHASGPDLDVENDLTIDLSAVVRLTDKDGDSVIAAARALTITVDDDGPALSGRSETGAVNEDVLTGGNPGGIGDNAATATDSGSVAVVFSSGADQPLTYGLASVTTGLQSLTSAGVTVTYAVAGNVLTASAAGATVFTFAITDSATGAYTFTLLKPLDHPAGDNENNIDIDLSTIVQATDYDGDTVNAGSGLMVVSISANDDTPEVTAATVPVAVDEDGLPFGIAGNNTGTGGGDLAGVATTATGSVSSLFSVGADQPGTYSVDLSDAALTQLTGFGLRSGGTALAYDVAGDTLTAKAGTATVFTFQLTSTGDFTFTLVDQLDHASTPGLDVENDLTIDLSAVVRLTDKDGDSVVAASGALTITVDDDGPALSGRSESGAVDEDVLTGGNPGGIGDVEASATHSGLVAAVFNSGADQPLTYGLSPSTSGLQSLTSAGAVVTYAVAGNVLTASASGEPVFTFAITNTTTGAYTFTLLKPLDHPEGQDENNLDIDLSTIVQATDYDGDTVNAGSGLMVVSISANDDTPVVTAATVPVAVDEDGLPFGIADNNVGTGGGDLAGAAITATGSVSTLFSVGADQPGTYSVDLSDAALTQLNGLGLLSGGTALTYTALGDTLTAKAGTAAVFTFQLTSTGDFTFTLVDQLDHASTPGLDVENDLSIDLSAVVRLTDKDGDSVVAAARALTITVDDDGPALSGRTETGAVNEDVLTGGNPGGIGDNAATATDTGSVAVVFSSGADQPLTYGLSPVTTGLTALTSAGATVTYAVAGNVLTASASGATVFTFAITDSTTGAYTFTLLKPLDHPAGENENDIVIDLSTIVQATDYDGDTVRVGAGLVVVSITANDDTPVVTANAVPVAVDEDGLPFGIASNNTGTGGGDLAGAATTATGSVSTLFSVGADQPGTYSIALSDTALAQLGTQGLRSGGVGLTYEAAGDTLTAKAGPATVFTFQLTSTGDFTFTLVDQLDHGRSVDEVENDLSIDLSAVMRLTDKDGDSVVAAPRALTITVDDDGPALSGRTETGAVNEDVLTGGNPGGIGDNAATATDTGSVAVVFSSGADQPLTYGLSSVTTGLTTLTSAGVTVNYAVEGNVLTASAGGEPVFTFAITNTTTGAYTFTLLKPLDHTAGLNENNIDIDLSAIVQATDYDGDAVSAGSGLMVVSITANDDTPVVTASTVNRTVDEDGLPFGIASNNTGTGGGDLGGEATTATGSVSTLFSVGADQPGTYSIASSAVASVQLANPNLRSGGVALTYEALGDTLTAKAGTATVFTFTLTSDGNFTFTLLGQLDHDRIDGPNVENDLSIDLSAVVRLTDKDGDSVLAASGALTITVDDDGPAILAFEDLTVYNTLGPKPSDTGAFSYNLGADQRTSYPADSDPLVTDFAPIMMGGTVGTQTIATRLVPLLSEDAASAVFDVSFQYAADPSQLTTLTNATGTLSFNKLNDTYSFELDAPLAGYTTVRTGGSGAVFQGYQLNSDLPDGTQPPVSVAELSEDFFVQFTGYQEPGSGTNSNNLKAGSSLADGDGTFEVRELFFQANTWVSVSGSANGVAGDTMQSGEVLDMDFFNYNPKGQTSAPANQQAAGIFLRFDGIGTSEDLVVVLKLQDGNTTTTRAMIVDNADIYKFGAPLPSTYDIGKPLDNNDGVVFIESNDYNVTAGDKYMITGAQILGSTEGISGQGIALNGATGESGGSPATLINFGTVNNDTTAATSESTSEPIKISDLGFVIANSANLDADLYFDVAVIDYDRDVTDTARLEVHIEGTAPMSAAELMATVQPVEPELLV